MPGYLVMPPSSNAKRCVCVCVMFVSVSASEKGTEGDDERRENRISCSKPHL